MDIEIKKLIRDIILSIVFVTWSLYIYFGLILPENVQGFGSVIQMLLSPFIFMAGMFFFTKILGKVTSKIREGSWIEPSSFGDRN